MYPISCDILTFRFRQSGGLFAHVLGVVNREVISHLT